MVVTEEVQKQSKKMEINYQASTNFQKITTHPIWNTKSHANIFALKIMQKMLTEPIQHALKLFKH